MVSLLPLNCSGVVGGGVRWKRGGGGVVTLSFEIITKFKQSFCFSEWVNQFDTLVIADTDTWAEQQDLSLLLFFLQ